MKDLRIQIENLLSSESEILHRVCKATDEQGCICASELSLFDIALLKCCAY